MGEVWQQQRNQQQTKVCWSYTADDARKPFNSTPMHIL